MKNYLSKMLYALTSAYSRKDYDNCQRNLPLETNIGKLFSLLAWGLDSVQEQTELIKLWEDIDNACGSVLDRYGANFGVKRISSDDRFYRLAIKVKMTSQLSGGDTNTIIRAASALLEVELTDILFEDVFPSKIALYVDKTLLSQERIELIEPIAYAIKRHLVAGIGMRLYLRTYRTYKRNLTMLQCGYTGPNISAEPAANEKRISQMRVNAACGALQTSKSSVAPSDVQRVSVSSRGNAGGVICYTHIKSKRID